MPPEAAGGHAALVDGKMLNVEFKFGLYKQAPTPLGLFTRKFLNRVQKQCSKGPPITKVLSSNSNLWVRLCIQKGRFTVK